MNSKIIIALIAIIISSVSGQYYYPSIYGGYYPRYYGYASSYPTYAGYAGYYPTAFSSLYYGYGSNKGNNVDNTKVQTPQVKLKNNQ
uniref:Uncharacterized protein n=1 Tax=Strongyloides stercoralis TaxID=6248 RepID=A0A0K0E970_STRER